MNRMLDIGTRESPLAIWQANRVAKLLNQQDYNTKLTYIKSDGETDLSTPLYELGVQGIFTRALDIALLEHKIDIAVHSYKDVPTVLAKGLEVAAVLKRDNPFDVLVYRNRDMEDVIEKDSLTIATSSIRRKAQWLYRYKNSQIRNIRGNVNTRLKKLQASDWDGAIFASAGLERLELGENETGLQSRLHWMLPAPAQGALVVVCRKEDRDVLECCKHIDDEETRLCTQVERDFLRLLQGGCSTPISAFATILDNELHFKGNITARDGSDSISVELRTALEDHTEVAAIAAKTIKERGGETLLKN